MHIIKKTKDIIKKYFELDNKGSFYGFSFSRKKKGYILYGNGDAKSICSYYVKKQKFHSDKESSDIINKWSSKYYRSLNLVLRSIIKVPKEKKQEYEEFEDKLSNLIDSTEGLEDDVILYKGETKVNLNRFKIGEINEFIGFTSTSFSKTVGLKFKVNDEENNYLIIIKAKRKTKGISIDGKKLGIYKNQANGY